MQFFLFITPSNDIFISRFWIVFYLCQHGVTRNVAFGLLPSIFYNFDAVHNPKFCPKSFCHCKIIFSFKHLASKVRASLFNVLSYLLITTKVWFFHSKLISR